MKNKNFKSNFEQDIFNQIKATGFNVEYEATELDYKRTYIPDFICSDRQRFFIVEAKGYFDPLARGKMLAVKESNPNMDIRFVFMQDNKISKKSRYSDWALKHGFPFSIGNINEEWFK